MIDLLKALWTRLLGVNSKLRFILLLFVAAVVIHNYPRSIGWLPEDLQADVQQAAYTIMQWAVAGVLLFAKQSNVSGNGTIDRPFEKPHEGASKIIGLLLAALLPLSFASCETTPAGETRWSPYKTLRVLGAAVDAWQPQATPAPTVAPPEASWRQPLYHNGQIIYPEVR